MRERARGPEDDRQQGDGREGACPGQSGSAGAQGPAREGEQKAEEYEACERWSGNAEIAEAGMGEVVDERADEVQKKRCD